MVKCSLWSRFIAIAFSSAVSLATFDCHGIFIKKGKWNGNYGNSVLAKFLNLTLYDVSGGGWNGCGYYAVCAGLNPQSGRYSRSDALAIRRIAYPDISDDADCRETSTAFSTKPECSGVIAKKLGITIGISGIINENGEEFVIIYRKDGTRTVKKVKDFDFNDGYGLNNGDMVVVLHRIPPEGMRNHMPHWVVGLPGIYTSNEFETITLPNIIPQATPRTNLLGRTVAMPTARPGVTRKKINQTSELSLRRRSWAHSRNKTKRRKKFHNNKRYGKSHSRKMRRKNNKPGSYHSARVKKFNRSARKNIKKI
ncbi:MAG: hypothetical protein LBI37_00345, partial [Puniceicoccales bacterium]|nr:hypothetical protein [Puniceicoccales bacterium]